MADPSATFAAAEYAAQRAWDVRPNLSAEGNAAVKVYTANASRWHARRASNRSNGNTLRYYNR